MTFNANIFVWEHLIYLETSPTLNKMLNIAIIITTLGATSESFNDLHKSVDFDSKIQKPILPRIIGITIRCTSCFTETNCGGN